MAHFSNWRRAEIMRLVARGVLFHIVPRSAGRADVATTMRYCSLADDVYADRIVAAFG